MKKILGVISWFPDIEPARSQRIDRINRFFNQINKFKPDLDILIIAQNWKDYKLPEISNKFIVCKYPCLGILRARKTLREEFLKLDYDYLIMADDDTIIEELVSNASYDYFKSIDEHPDGFMFLQYDAAQLNMCAISKELLEKEDIVNVDAQKNEGFEDVVYSHLLHYKYPDKEFTCCAIRCTQFQNTNEVAPSTWAGTEKRRWEELSSISYYIIDGYKKGDFDTDRLKQEGLIKAEKERKEFENSELGYWFKIFDL